MTCPSGMIHRAKAEKIYCLGFNCTDADLDICCASEAQCSSYLPPEGYVHKLNADHITCRNITCTAVDLETCTDPVGHCSSFNCTAVIGKVHTDGAGDIPCDEKLCLP